MADRWMDERDREWRERDWLRAEGYGRRAEERGPTREPGRGGEGRSWAEGGDPGDARSYRADRDREERRAGHERGGDFLQRAGDRISSWLRDETTDARPLAGPHRGRGPRGYQRSDARISEEVHDCLTDDPWLDATDIEVAVKDGEVTLSGRVDSREAKHRAERLIEDLSGVRHVQINLRVDPSAGLTGGDFTGAGRGFGSSAVEAEMRRNEEATGLDPRTGRRRG